eukprot:gene11907-12002_t
MILIILADTWIWPNQPSDSSKREQLQTGLAVLVRSSTVELFPKNASRHGDDITEVGAERKLVHQHADDQHLLEASWRSGDAEDCKSFNLKQVEIMNAEIQRQAMVDGQIRTNEVSDPALLEALYTIPREIFVPAELSAVAYSDLEIPLDSSRSLLMPMVAAKMIQALNLVAGETVLDVAGGTGYSAAVMAKAGADVTALEDSATLSAAAKSNFVKLSLGYITVKTDQLDGSAGQGKAFDAILVNGAVDTIPAKLLEQLKDRGRLVAVVGRGRSAKAVQFERSGDVFSSRNLFDAAAPVLTAFEKQPEFAF